MPEQPNSAGLYCTFIMPIRIFPQAAAVGQCRSVGSAALVIATAFPSPWHLADYAA